MKTGFVILAHGSLRRTAQLARALARQGGSVVVHVDKSARREEVAQLKLGCRMYPGIWVLQAVRCRWGDWSIVEATLASCRQILDSDPDISHVCLLSGDTLPLVPLPKLHDRLSVQPDTDFLESVRLDMADWVRGGLAAERFTLFHHWNWTTQRRRFDLSVRVQRALRVRRDPPEGLTLHLGSQWWCLTRHTLNAILRDAGDRKIVRFFGNSWIPDESFFQTMARRHARRIVSASLTFADFDGDGRPRVFYDDNLSELARCGKIFARKIWPGADRLYGHFLLDRQQTTQQKRAPLLALHGRAPHQPALPPAVPMARAARIESARPYTVLAGVREMFPKLESWLDSTGELTSYGRLFSNDCDGRFSSLRLPGGLTASAALRDNAPCAFLSNLLRQSGPGHPVLEFRPDDDPDVFRAICADPNAQIVSIDAGWSLSRRWRAERFCDRLVFARTQRRDSVFQAEMDKDGVSARVSRLSMGCAASAPASIFRACVPDVAKTRPVAGFPEPVPVALLVRAIRDFVGLRDVGLNPAMLSDAGAALKALKPASQMAPEVKRKQSGSGRLDSFRIG